MDLFRFLKRQIRASVPPPQPIPPAEVARSAAGPIPTHVAAPSLPTPYEIRRLMFDAVASGDEARLHALCEEHQDLIVRHGEAWLEVPPEFRSSAQLEAWYANGLRAIREYCAERSSEKELTDGVRGVLDPARVRPEVLPEHER